MSRSRGGVMYSGQEMWLDLDRRRGLMALHRLHTVGFSDTLVKNAGLVFRLSLVFLRAIMYRTGPKTFFESCASQAEAILQ